jgi:hypothetical protein
VLLFFPAVVQAGGTLYLGSEGQLTALGIFTTNGPTVTSQTQVGTAGYDFNGVGEGAGLTGIVTGALDSGNFNTRDLAGNLIGSFTNATPGYLNEDFAGNGTELWRANSNNPPTIYKLDPTNGNTLETHILAGASQLVGLTFVGSQIWAGDFGAGTVGTVDTTLDTYTPVFNAFGSTLLGGLAYDSTNGVLWVGSFDVIRPYSTAGVVLGPDVSTTAVYPGFIDGLAYVVPEPSSLVIAMTLCGGFGLMAVRRRRQRQPE